MGGSRPMTVGRAVSLGALIAVLLGVATGLSHIGSTPTATTCTGNWWVVISQTTSEVGISVGHSRALHMAPTTCTGSAVDPKGGYLVTAIFETESEARAYLRELVRVGYGPRWDFKPYLMPAVATTPTMTTP